MNQPTFTTNYQEILERIAAVDPLAYAKTRNFIDGDITYLSAYISRGLLTLPQVAKMILAKGYKPFQVIKFLQELAWREYYQRVWLHHGPKLFTDIKLPQQDVAHHKMLTAVDKAQTGIESIDAQINNLYQTGYMHNHARMYTAGITCSMGKAHWLQPSRWLYYHLLDGDLASNACSWQWVAGSFSQKKYIANQENINRYMHGNQQQTFLDCSYETILGQPIPTVLEAVCDLALHTQLPATDASFCLNNAVPLLVYTTYWLNPEWYKNQAANRVLLLEPSHFSQYPVSDKVLGFCLELAQKNIPNVQIFVGEFAALQTLYQGDTMISLDHPLHQHFSGIKHPYPWMFPQVAGYSPSFFSFWKKCEKYMHVLEEI